MAAAAILEKFPSGNISATGRRIHFVFGYRVRFPGTADLMALFSIRTNSRWQPPPSWIISNGHIFATAHDSAHRAVIFAIAQLSCFNTSVKTTPIKVIKRRKRQKLVYCIFACKKSCHQLIITVSSSSDIV